MALKETKCTVNPSNMNSIVAACNKVTTRMNLDHNDVVIVPEVLFDIMIEALLGLQPTINKEPHG